MREPEPEQGDDVDDGGVEVDDVGEHRSSEARPPAIEAMAPTIGMPAATKPPKTKTMTRRLTGRAMPSPARRSLSTWW